MRSIEANFADALKRARGNKSQAEFAVFLEIKQQSYSRYERGLIPDGKTLLTIASKLNTSIEELLTGEKRTGYEPSSRDTEFNPEPIELFIGFLKMFSSSLLQKGIVELTSRLEVAPATEQPLILQTIEAILTELKTRANVGASSGQSVEHGASQILDALVKAVDAKSPPPPPAAPPSSGGPQNSDKLPADKPHPKK